MNVTLPDGTALELPEGSSALDAARAIGPKLAEQAVLARVDGEPRDLRLPLPDGAKLQILTTRDHDDPDALHVLRHSASHLLAEAVRRLHPGVKVAIGPPIENGFYYDFEFPEPIREEDLAAIEEEVQRELSEGRAWERVDIGRDDARARFEAEGEPYKVELVDTAEGDISLYTQGDFTDLCRGPHLQDSKPIKAFKVTGLAGAYWRGDEKNTQLTRIYGTAFFTQADLDAYLARLETARANDHRRLGPQLDLFHLQDASPGSPFWHPRGMTALERARGPPPQRERTPRLPRGEDAAHLRQDRVGDVGALGEVPWRDVPHGRRGRGATRRTEADELPGAHAPIRQPAPRATATSRCATRSPRRCTATSPPGRCTGFSASGHVTQDDAHIFCTREQIEQEIFGSPRLRGVPLRPVRHGRTLRALDPAGRQARAPTRSGTSPRARSGRALERRGIEYYVGEGEGAFYGPKIDLHMKDVAGPRVADGDDPARCADAEAVRPHLHGCRQRRAPSYVVHRALLGSLERFIGILIEHYGGAFPTWLAPVQVRVVPVADGHRTAAHELVDALRGERVRAEVDERDETLGKRIRDAELQKVPYSRRLG